MQTNAHHSPEGARPGDWIEARGIEGQPSRRGQIVEVLGGEGHRHYRVRWDEQHESLLYPADGVVILPQSHTGHPGGATS